MQAGLVGGEGFSIDASLIKAHADKKKQVPGDQPIAGPNAEETSRAVREYLVALDAARSDEESGGKADGGVARKGIDPFFAYDANYLIDNKFCVIVDARARAPTVQRKSRSPRPG